MKYVAAGFVALVAIVMLTFPAPAPHAYVLWRAIGWIHLAGAFFVFLPDAWRFPASRLSRGARAVLARAWLFVAGAIVVWGVAIAAVGVAALARGELDGIMSLLGAALELVAAHALARPSLRHARDERRALAERAERARALDVVLMRAAHGLGGRMTCADAVVLAGLPFDDARAALEGLATRGACERLVTPSGAMLYRFADLEPTAARLDVLDAR